MDKEPDILVPFTRIVPKHLFQPTLIDFHYLLRSSIGSMLVMAVEDIKRNRSKKRKIKILNWSNPLKATILFWIGEDYDDPTSKVLNIAISTRVGSTVTRINVAHLLSYIEDTEDNISIYDSDASWIIAKAILIPLINYNRYRDLDSATCNAIANYLSNVK